MGNTETRVTIEGLDELLARLDEPAVREAVMPRMEQAVLLWEAGARQRSPVDTGHLRMSITHQVRDMGSEVVGEVGSNVFYAPFQEFGTGVYADGPYPSRSARRGGLRPRRYLRDSLADKMSDIRTVLAKTLSDVAQKLGFR